MGVGDSSEQSELGCRLVGKRINYYRDVASAQWNDWRWQQRNRIESADELARVVSLTADEQQACAECSARFRMAITPYYAELMDPDDPSCPVRRQAIPTLAELQTSTGERPDPLAEEAHMPVPGVTHRYPDRALLYTTHNCPVYCRFCTRKRKVGNPTSAPAKTQLTGALDYIASTPEITDVIVSGGDPLSLTNERLSNIFESLAAIPHVQTARLATRNLVTLPQRVDEGLCDLLRHHQSRHLAIYVMTHFNHVKECTDLAWSACERVISTGTPIMNQMVLLAGINDSAPVVTRLNRQLLRMRVKPYYILHADMSEGIGHFRTHVKQGQDLIDQLRGHISGIAVPQYVVDLPGGGGKVPVIPNYVMSQSDNGWVFRNYRGDSYELDE